MRSSFRASPGNIQSAAHPARKRSHICHCLLWAIMALSLYSTTTIITCGRMRSWEETVVVVDVEKKKMEEELAPTSPPEPITISCNFLQRSSRKLGHDPNRFVAVLHLNEQITKAKLHLVDIIHWARQLNRTLILPTVGSSSISMSKPLPYCTYFDTQSLGEVVDWITEDYFWELMKGKNARMMHLHVKYSNGPCKLPNMFLKEDMFASAQAESMDWMHTRVRDFKHAFLQLGRDENRTVCVSMEDIPRYNFTAMDQRIHQALQKQNVQRMDVLLVTKFAPYQLIAKDIQKRLYLGVQYAPHLVKSAELVSSQLGPRYVAMHWRTEKCLEVDECTAEVFAKCARSLVATIQRLKNESGIGGVFFASDISAKGVALSTSIVGADHHIRGNKRVAASNIIRDAYNEMKPVTWADIEPASQTLDVGVQGILDKVACAKADRFIRAPKECALHFSSYTGEILDLRQEWGKKQIDEMWNFEEGSPVTQTTPETPQGRVQGVA